MKEYVDIPYVNARNFWGSTFLLAYLKYVSDSARHFFSTVDLAISFLIKETL